MISVVVRTKNESVWIRQCLGTVFSQRNEDFEVILVDNNSTDNTLDIAREFDIKILEIGDNNFSYGKALNLGIASSNGDYICCLSGHCFAENNDWLFWLKSNFKDPMVAGVYGRQKPIRDSHPIDKRDLWTLFGPEKKIQMKDPFFHNANSMIKKSVWEKVQFDETSNGLEDRIWAKNILDLGHKIAYEPLAAVYHPHGINHQNDPKRAARIVDVIENSELYLDN
jgi:rhamnosyltransferase